MPIEFHCEHCGKEIKAPDEAGGRRGKCPYCGQSNYIPATMDADEIPIAPEDEEFERQRQKEIEELRARERDLIAESGGDESHASGGAASSYYPDREDGEAAAEVAPGDLYHHVVQYCLAVSNSDLETAEEHAKKLRSHGYTGLEAVDDLLTGKEIRPELDRLPAKLLNGFLQQLRNRLR